MWKHVILVTCALLLTVAYGQKGKTILDKVAKEFSEGLLKELEVMHHDKAVEKMTFSQLDKALSFAMLNYPDFYEMLDDFNKGIELYFPPGGGPFGMHDDFKAIFHPTKKVQAQIQAKIKNLLSGPDKRRASQLGFYQGIEDALMAASNSSKYTMLLKPRYY